MSLGRLFSVFSRYSRIACLCVLVGMTGCAYKIEIKQGKEDALEDIKQVQVGMSKEEVQAQMGRSLLDSLFRDNVWVYSYSLREKGFIGEQAIRTIKIYFDSGGRVRDIQIEKLGAQLDEGDDPDEADEADDPDEEPDPQTSGDDAAAE